MFKYFLYYNSFMVKFKSIVTDPSEHRDESFVYLVSGIVQVYPETNTEEAEEYMQWRIDRILTPGSAQSTGGLP